jgi:capsular polysaccharide biosynthesis protein
MSQEVLDLRRFVRVVRRFKILVGGVVLVGILGGAGYALHSRPMLTSTALVLLPQAGQSAAAAADGLPDPYTSTQQVIAGSNDVLSRALPDVRPAMTLAQLRLKIQIGTVTPYIISVTAQGKTDGDAEATANAVAASYIHFIGSASSPVGRVSAQLIQPAASVSGTRLPVWLAFFALIGAIAGGIIGMIIALGLSRTDRRLRERDEIANSIGVPVLASFPAAHPSDVPGWTKLLEEYRPGALHAVQLRRVLQSLQLSGQALQPGEQKADSSFAVLCLSSDPGAFALGPQLAVFAASQGIRTALVIGPHQAADAAATLRIAATAFSGRPGNLSVSVCDGPGTALPDEAALTVIVGVLDSKNPQVPEGMPGAAMVVGVSSGAATAEQLARVSVSAAAEGHEIAAILVADPDPADHTTGRVPQLLRPAQRRLPMRLKA